MKKYIVAVRLSDSNRSFVRKVQVYTMFEFDARLMALDFCRSHYSSRNQVYDYYVLYVKQFSLPLRFLD